MCVRCEFSVDQSNHFSFLRGVLFVLVRRKNLRITLPGHDVFREKRMDDQKRILLVSRDLMVLQTRKLMLGAYFEVCAAGRVLEAKALLAEHQFDLIVLCYTLTDDDCEKILNGARLHSPKAKTLILTVT